MAQPTRDNALKRQLRSPVFRQRIVKNKKGKGAYSRKGSPKHREPFFWPVPFRFPTATPHH